MRHVVFSHEKKICLTALHFLWKIYCHLAVRRRFTNILSNFVSMEGFLHILREYLDHYNLGMTATDLDALDINMYRPWAKLILTGRIGSAGRSEIFEAAIYNGLYCVHGWTAHEYEQASGEAGTRHHYKLWYAQSPPNGYWNLDVCSIFSLAEALMDGEDTFMPYDKPWKIHKSEMSEALERGLRFIEPSFAMMR